MVLEASSGGGCWGRGRRWRGDFSETSSTGSASSSSISSSVSSACGFSRGAERREPRPVTSGRIVAMGNPPRRVRQVDRLFTHKYSGENRRLVECAYGGARYAV